MEMRKLGRTGPEISRLVFGCGAVGGVVFNAPPEEAREAVRRALAHGINWFDTAASYGDGRSEERLGEILRELGAAPRVSTKVGLKPDELGDIPGAVRRSLEKSLSRLKRSSVDLFQLHNHVTRERGVRRDSLGLADVLGDRGVAAAFERLRGEGLFRWSGFTGLGEPEALKRMIASGVFHTVQTYFNLLNPSALLTVPKGFSALDMQQLAVTAHRSGLGVLNIRVLAAGALAGRPLPAGGAPLTDGADATAENARAAALLKVLGADERQLYRLALRFALQQSKIDAVLIGFSTADQVDSAVSVLADPPIEAETLRRITKLYGEPPFVA